MKLCEKTDRHVCKLEMAARWIRLIGLERSSGCILRVFVELSRLCYCLLDDYDLMKNVIIVVGLLLIYLQKENIQQQILIIKFIHDIYSFNKYLIISNIY